MKHQAKSNACRVILPDERIALEAFCVLSGDDFSGIFTTILIFYPNQTEAQSHSQRLKTIYSSIKTHEITMYISHFFTKNSVLLNSFSTFSGLPVDGNSKPGFVFLPYDSKSITDLVS